MHKNKNKNGMLHYEKNVINVHVCVIHLIYKAISLENFKSNENSKVKCILLKPCVVMELDYKLSS